MIMVHGDILSVLYDIILYTHTHISKYIEREGEGREGDRAGRYGKVIILYY